jgi:HTH-type transcriptional regulator/antitoxin HipB
VSTRAGSLIIQLAGIRRAQGLTQREVAARAGIDQAALSHIETGLSGAALDTAERITQALGLELRLVPREDL